MNTAIKYIGSVAALILLTSPAGAAEFRQVQPSESAVTFGFTQMGVPLEGKFNQFSAQIYFDPAKLAKAQARIDINVSSIDTGSAEGNEEVVGKKWFNAKDYPTASFVSTDLKALGGNRYQATGKLSIKGRTLDVTTPVTFQANGTHGSFDGAFTIKRLDYMIGEGEWTDVSSVANEIQIKFHVVVNAAPSHK
ncbi:protein YceI [Sideroxyarcus emersonii]|uniref:Protein YceI n=1 Tax=Sideroxyarcus emersonii TaxID=2764705 RepID=A0AAN1XA38_9PROT|nr:YceI family protein [Sideroxyarcus emersonii]BCK87362.1 protein YceI [Sideroxyarcus emersonii]